MSWGENLTTDGKQFQCNLSAASHNSYLELMMASMLSIHVLLRRGVYQSEEKAKFQQKWQKHLSEFCINFSSFHDTKANGKSHSDMHVSVFVRNFLEWFEMAKRLLLLD